MSIVKDLVNAVIQKRTCYYAIFNGSKITGCGDCGNNQPYPGLLPIAPTHKCIIAVDDNGQMKVIYDPFNIPEWCPIKVEPKKE